MHEELPCKITICMGSSCFSRGNNKNIEVLEEYIRTKNINAEVEISGNLCEDKCNKGPNLKINNTFHHNIDPNSLIRILNHYFLENKQTK